MNFAISDEIGRRRLDVGCYHLSRQIVRNIGGDRHGTIARSRRIGAELSRPAP
jgi:hypothetical protein